MPLMPPPSREMMSSAKRCATVRAMSSLAASLYCRASTGGLPAVRRSISQPYTTRRPLSAESAPNATMDALAGGADHCAGTSSCGEPGMACGARLFDTMSKMPALVRSL